MKFSIRDLLWLTVVIAISAGWYAHYRYYSEGLRQAKHDNRELMHRYLTERSPYD